jgi:hypothetical protein
MICRDCQVAGFMNAEANHVTLQSGDAAESIRALARSWHRKCRDKDCACQHIIGVVLDRHQIAELREKTARDRERHVKAQEEEARASEAESGAGIPGADAA